MELIDLSTHSAFSNTTTHWIPTRSIGLYNYYGFAIPVEGKKTISVCVEDIPEGSNYDLRIFNPYMENGEYDLLKKCGREEEITNTDNDTGVIVVFLLYYFEVPGEYITRIKIDGEEFELGIPVEGEDEILTTSLVNKGVELPQDIYKSFYSTDPLNDRPDWKVLNDHLRGLLQHYMEVIGGKGSYSSLLKSLEWFGYQDLVALKEWWKFNTPDRTKLFAREITKCLTPSLREEMFHTHKTTFVSLKCDWEKSGKACQWSYEEMWVKMILLGHFFSTYFLPIHTSLIESVVEVSSGEPTSLPITYATSKGFNCQEVLDEVMEKDWFKDSKEP